MVVAGDSDPSGSNEHGASLELGVEWLVRSPALEMGEHVLVAGMEVVDDDHLVPVSVVTVPPLVSVLDVDLPRVVYECPGGVGLTGPRRSPVPTVDLVEVRRCQLLDVLRQCLVKADCLMELYGIAKWNIAVVDGLNDALGEDHLVTGFQVALVVAACRWRIAMLEWWLCRKGAAFHLATIFPGFKRIFADLDVSARESLLNR